MKNSQIIKPVLYYLEIELTLEEVVFLLPMELAEPKHSFVSLLMATIHYKIIYFNEQPWGIILKVYYLYVIDQHLEILKNSKQKEEKENLPPSFK